MVFMFDLDGPLRFGRASQISHGGLGRLSKPHPSAGFVRDRCCGLPLFGEGIELTDIGDSMFHKGQPVWVIQSDGSQRAAEYVGEGEMSAWFGGSPTVIVVYPDTHSGGAVEVDRVIAREA